jgi:hypothetical protein
MKIKAITIIFIIIIFMGCSSKFDLLSSPHYQAGELANTIGFKNITTSIVYRECRNLLLSYGYKSQDVNQLDEEHVFLEATKINARKSFTNVVENDQISLMIYQRSQKGVFVLIQLKTYQNRRNIKGIGTEIETNKNLKEEKLRFEIELEEKIKKRGGVRI